MLEQENISPAGSLKIKLLGLLKNDMWIYTFLAINLIIIGLYLFLEYSGYNIVRRNGAVIGKEHAKYYGMVIPVVVPLLLIVIGWRYAKFKSLLAKSVLVMGKIIDVSRFDKGSVIVTASYRYGNQKYRRRKIVVFPNERVLYKGNQVEMVVNQEKPNKALIKDLFFKE